MHWIHNGVMKMAMLTVRKPLTGGGPGALPHQHRAAPGFSMEAEVRAILESAVSPEGRVKLGSLLADVGRRAKLTEEEVTVFEQVRNKGARQVSLELNLLETDRGVGAAAPDARYPRCRMDRCPGPGDAVPIGQYRRRIACRRSAASRRQTPGRLARKPGDAGAAAVCRPRVALRS